MYLLRLTLAALFIALLQVPASYAGVKQLLQNKILGPGTPLQEVISFTGSRVPPMPVIESKADWEARASLIRQRMLDEVVFRDELHVVHGPIKTQFGYHLLEITSRED